MTSIELTKVIKGKYEDTFKYTAMSLSSDEPNQNKLGIFIGGKSKKSKSNSISMFNNMKSNNIYNESNVNIINSISSEKDV